MASPLLAQTPASPAALDRQWLAGTWTLDKSQPPEDEKNWNRLPKLPPGTPNPTGPANDGTNGSQERARASSLIFFGRTLIAPSETVKLVITSDMVTIEDDFREATSFAPRDTVSLKVVTRPARKESLWVTPPRTITVKVKTSWKDGALAQELWTRDTSEIVRITRTFIPFDDGRQMLFVIKVLEPKLKPPVKDIERVYVRSLVPGPGSSVPRR